MKGLGKMTSKVLYRSGTRGERETVTLDFEDQSQQEEVRSREGKRVWGEDLSFK